MKTDFHSVLLASGGLDSTVLAYWLISQRISFLPVFVDYGQHSAVTELTTLKSVLPQNLSEKILVVRLEGMFPGSSSRMLVEADLWADDVTDDDLYVPYRNQLLLSVGCAVAKNSNLEIVYSAFIESNLALGEDCKTEFLQAMNGLCKNFGGVRLEFPFMEFSKAKVAQLGLTLGAPIERTFSCLVGSKIPCGVCPNCVDRLGAMRVAAEIPR